MTKKFDEAPPQQIKLWDDIYLIDLRYQKLFLNNQ